MRRVLGRGGNRAFVVVTIVLSLELIVRLEYLLFSVDSGPLLLIERLVAKAGCELGCPSDRL